MKPSKIRPFITAAIERNDRVLAWFGDEEFWKGVGASIVAGAILAFAGILAAATTSLISWPTAIGTALCFLLVIAPSVSIIFGRAIRIAHQKVKKQPNTVEVKTMAKLGVPAIAALILLPVINRFFH